MLNANKDLIMIRLYFISIFLLIFSSQYAQTIHGKIVDSLNNPIQYVNIGVLGGNIGTVSDQNGNFNLNVSKSNINSKIIVSIIGYKSKEFSTQNFIDSLEKRKQIVLQENIEKLKEVTVFAKKMKKDVLGNQTTSSLIEAGFKNNSLGSEVGVKIKIKNKPTYIDSFNYFITSCKYDSIFFRLNIYSIKDDMPYENLLFENIYFSTDIKKGRVSIDLKKYNIIVTQDVIVAIEYVKELGKGGLNFSGGLFGNKLYHRQTSFSEWEKTGTVSLGFNVDVRY